ncbi:putative MFS family arabinose efflux permease [Actinocorallia herbida]|uniref:Putative MFS family arabinose efflux permease n=1 Tax=Actinocorallia herbida TaxID=58109 RepID=A0A3N1DCM8_9ACTN|nr:MFS transporter [Actinocorallia herbida]ROO91277.1 putative MFS family arabinose efflux permease [Actinocorallia herbida]
MFRSLRNRNYRYFLSGQVISNTGTWMQRIAQDWLVLQLTHGSGTALGITTALQFLPMLLFGLWGGVVADRIPRRKLIAATQVGLALPALVLGLLDVGGIAQVWHVYVLAFGLGVATVFDNPARQAFVSELVGKDDLPNAVALNSATFNGARVVGPAVAGVLIAMIGTGPVFLINFASFGAVLYGLWRMRESELHTHPPVPRQKGQLREGLRYVRNRPDLVMILVTIALVAGFAMNFQITTALVATKDFGMGASQFGLASTAMAVGSVTGALLAARRVRPNDRLLYGSVLLFGVAAVLVGIMPTWPLFLAMLVPTGVLLMTFTTAANATMQLGVAADMRGRVMGLYMLVFMGVNPITAPFVGWMAGEFGGRVSIVFGGTVAVLTGFAAILLRRGAAEDAEIEKETVGANA